MDWKFPPIALAVAACFAGVSPNPAAADFLTDLNTGTQILCRFANCNGSGGRAAPTPSAPRPTTTRPGPSAADIQRSNAERQGNIDVQTALNGFGFNVGTADGSLGPRSRAAISDYQQYLGYPPSGYLDDNQRWRLLDSYRRLQQGEGARYQQVVAAEGTRGLLRAFNDPSYIGRYGVPPNADPSGSAYPGTVAGTPQAIPQPGPQPGPQPSPQPAPQVAQAAGPSGGMITPITTLPPLVPNGVAAQSMADRCEFVELTTKTNGPIRVADMSDPAQALSEQFCEARSYAISVSQSMSANIKASEEQLASACQTVSTAMAPTRAALAGDTPEAIVAKARAANVQIGLGEAANAATYGQICLGLGYRRDDAEMALSAGLLLVGAGFQPYGETVGHHLREGFGVGESTDAALPWYKAALAALDANAQPAFLPSKTGERSGVIRAAIESGQIRADAATTIPGTVPAALPALVPAAATLPAGHLISQ